MKYVEASVKSPAPINVEPMRDGRLRIHGIPPQPITLPKNEARTLRDALIAALGATHTRRDLKKRRRESGVTNEDFRDYLEDFRDYFCAALFRNPMF
jgi:hypothetical protein